jgi:hypothetical protein
LQAGLDREGIPCELHCVWHGTLDPSQAPPEGVFWNRMSPSAHTRGHGEGVQLMREWLYWLESWGRKVINGSNAFELEISKFRQDMALRRAGIKTPRTVLAVGRDELLALGATFDGPFITKHNQGGKGLGIHLFDSVGGLRTYVESAAFDPGPNGQIVLQEYIRSPGRYITRVELVGGRFLFAMKSSTAQGFELCPADACQTPHGTEPGPGTGAPAPAPASATPDVCPADGAPAAGKFTPSEMDAGDPLVAQYRDLCEREGFEIAGIEFVEDERGERYTYDINGNTNYNSVLGAMIGVDGMRECARWVGQQMRAGAWDRWLRAA